MNQDGWTLYELIIVLGILTVITFWGTIFYVGWHFISKWW